MFTYNDVEPFLIAAVKPALSAGEELFAVVESQTVGILKKYSDLDTTAALPTEMLLPAAWIMSYVFVQRASKINPEELTRYETLYNRALSLLKRKNNAKKFHVGHIKGLWK